EGGEPGLAGLAGFAEGGDAHGGDGQGRAEGDQGGGGGEGGGLGSFRRGPADGKSAGGRGGGASAERDRGPPAAGDTVEDRAWRRLDDQRVPDRQGEEDAGRDQHPLGARERRAGRRVEVSGEAGQDDARGGPAADQGGTVERRAQPDRRQPDAEADQ